MIWEAMRVALWVAAPVLAACALVGLVGSLLQATTQASDASLGFVPKWLAVAAALWLSRDFMASRVIELTAHAFQAMSELGR